METRAFPLDSLANTADRKQPADALVLFGVTGDLAFLLEVDVVSLCVELTDVTSRRPKHDGIQFLDRGAVDRLMGRNRKVWLRDEIEGDPEIYGGAADLVRSDALLRLNISGMAPAGLIAFGTRHPGYFHVGQGTELMSFLGRIIEFGVRSLPEGAEEEERNRLLEPILGEISEQSPLEQARLLKLVHERIGGGVSMATLKEQIRAIQKDRKVEFRNEKKKTKRMSGAMPGSCRARVDEVLIDT